MRYWVFQNNQVTGPYEPEDLGQVAGYSGEALVCPDGKRGTSMGDWQRASMVPELALSILKASQMAVALKGGGGYGSLPPEPTLRDLAALGSLQEKVSLLDNTVSHLQESLRLKEEELLSVHKELEDKTTHAQALAVQLGGLEERFAQVKVLQQGLDKAVETEQGMDSTIKQQSEVIETLRSQLDSLREEQKQVEEIRGQLAKVKEDQVRGQEEAERRLSEAKTALEQEAHKYADEAAQKAEDSARRMADEAKAAAEEASKKISAMPPARSEPPLGLAPSPLASAPSPLSDAPSPLVSPAPLSGGLSPAPAEALGPSPSAAAKLGLPSERPSDAPLGGSPFSVDIPSSPMGGGPVPLTPLGDAPPVPLGLGGGAPPPAGPGFGGGLPMAGSVPSVGEPPVTKEPPAGEAPKRNLKPVLLIVVALAAAGGFGAMKMGLLGGAKKAPMPASPEPDRAPLPAPSLGEAPAPTAELEQQKQQAIEILKAWPLPDGTVLGLVLESSNPPQGGTGLSPWMADKIRDGLFQVNFYGQKTEQGGGMTYEFEVTLMDKRVTARNEPAAALLAPKAAPAPKGKGKAPKVKIKEKPAAPAGDDKPLLEELLSVDENAPEPKPVKKAKARKAAKADDGSGDVLIDGSGIEEPAAEPAKPTRKSPKKRVNRNVDAELNDILSDDPKEAKAAGPKEESLDALLAPAEKGEAAPQAEPSEFAEMEQPAEEEAPAKPAPAKAAKKKPQAADADLLDDLLKP
jgi:hypothetical protein